MQKGMFRAIIKNKNWNCFCFDLLKAYNKAQKLNILTKLSPNLSEDYKEKFDTHPLQKIIKLDKCEEEYNLITGSFNNINNILMTSLNQNGSFAI